MQDSEKFNTLTTIQNFITFSAIKHRVSSVTFILWKFKMWHFHNVKITTDYDVKSCYARNVKYFVETWSKTENSMDWTFKSGFHFTCETGFIW